MRYNVVMRRIIHYLQIVTLVVVIAGCAVTGPVAPGPAPRPTPREGDTYVWDARRLHRVVEVSALGVTWSKDHERHQTSADFFATPQRVTSLHAQTVSRLEGDPARLWPLEVGKSVSFIETRTDTAIATGRSTTQTLQWRCEVTDARMSYVPAGDYATYRVECRASRGPLPVQRISWEYAPLLGHYVRHVTVVQGREEERVLVARLPGALATPARIERLLNRPLPD